MSSVRDRLIPEQYSRDLLPNHTSIKNIVFDLGNVIIGWDPYLTVADQMSREEWEAFSTRADFGALNQRADAGESISELRNELALRDPDSAAILAESYRNFPRSLTGPIPGMVELIRDLQASGYRLFGLTNWSRETFPFAAQSVPLIDELEDVVISGEEKVAKPEAGIYQILLDRNGLTPEETVFIDDRAVNVEAAQDLGVHGLVFEDAQQLRRELQELDIEMH